MQLLKRVLKVLFGLVLYAIGVVMTIRANIGLAPWDAFSIGIAGVTGISYGTVVVLTGVLILVAVLFMKEKIGVATIMNTLLLGTFSDILIGLDIIPLCENMWWGALMLVGGIAVIGLGSYFYISPGLGCGPRDSLMVALGKRFKRVPIGVVRGCLEGTVLLCGWLLGAKVGLGTVLSVLLIGFSLQGWFRVFRFDVKALEHESIIKTARDIQRMVKKDAPDAGGEKHTDPDD